MSSADLLNCQRVCQSWYSPAHSELLKEVQLTSNCAVEQFVASIDLDSNQPYLNAIKTIQILGNESKESQPMILERATIEKLFFRFPILNKVQLSQFSLLENFTEELCNKILSRCPKLDTFDVVSYEEETDYCNKLLKVRPLLTNMQLSFDDPIPNPNDAVRFITRFPRLRHIHWDDETFNSFNLFLPILKQLSNVKSADLAVVDDISKSFGEKYLSTKSRDELLNRLSNITELILKVYGDIGNTLKFISKYFTGLEEFELRCELYDLGPDDQDLLCTNIFKAIPSINGKSSADLENVHYASLSRTFSSLIQNMFQNVPPAHKQPSCRVLDLFVVLDDIFKSDTILLYLKSVQSRLSRKITIMLNRNFNTDRIARDLFKSNAPMDEIDTFMLTFEDGHFSRTAPIDTNNYLKLLATMPSLKRVELRVPATFMETNDQPYTVPVLYQVKQVSFTAVGCNTMQTLLDKCCSAFPNISCLEMHNYNGIYKAHVGDFQLDLQDYSLEKLTLDAKPVVLKLDAKKMAFFVLVVESQENSERRLYKVSSDLSTSSLIHDSDLKGFKRPKDYLRVSLTVTCLKEIELHAEINGFTRKRLIMIDKGSE